MSEHRQDQRGPAHSRVAEIPDNAPPENPRRHPTRAHGHLLGHLIITILLAALAAIAAWLLLTSPPGESKTLPRAGALAAA